MSSKTREATFKPERRERQTKVLLIETTLEFHERIKTSARGCGLSMKSFILQALEFALDNMESPG